MPDAQRQHRANARNERHWMGNARTDQRYLHGRALDLQAHGRGIEANFMQHEANIAAGYVGVRKKILNREIHLARVPVHRGE